VLFPEDEVSSNPEKKRLKGGSHSLINQSGQLVDYSQITINLPDLANKPDQMHHLNHTLAIKACLT
jgi:hypothetical protein